MKESLGCCLVGYFRGGAFIALVFTAINLIDYEKLWRESETLYNLVRGVYVNRFSLINKKKKELKVKLRDSTNQNVIKINKNQIIIIYFHLIKSILKSKTSIILICFIIE